MTAAALQKRPPKITLRDVINHMSHMEQRLTAHLHKHDEQFILLEKKITLRMDTLEENLTRRINALDEDLMATINDTLKIRTFVGMPLPEED